MLSLASVLLALAPLWQSTPAKDLRSKSVETRLQAIESLASSEPGKEVTKLLVGALKDDDWEVVEAAITALGTVGGKGADRKCLISPSSASSRTSCARSASLRMVNPLS